MLIIKGLSAHFQSPTSSSDPPRYLFKDLSFNVPVDPLNPQILTVVGPSGSGKSTLLKCIAQLIPYDSGKILLGEKSPADIGIPEWRSQIQYVPQRPPALPGTTPEEFIKTMSQFGAQRKRQNVTRDPIEIGLDWGLSEDLWTKNFNQLSGGELQRIVLAIAVSREPLVLLLDEPTSALDHATTLKVERTLKSMNCIWVTHSPEQEARVSTSRLQLGPSPTIQ
ncbi:hypothetical protein HDV05_004833 [Chytridiales sp. JEL 0842]|nr:hypothetical protein HDV05_004833 [Chytridiales sp. JEL 0842]